jgi:hypothetical protein
MLRHNFPVINCRDPFNCKTVPDCPPGRFARTLAGVMLQLENRNVKRGRIRVQIRFFLPYTNRVHYVQAIVLVEAATLRMRRSRKNAVDRGEIPA